MANLIEKSKALMLVAVACSLVAAVFALLWGAARTARAVALIVTSYGQDPFIILHLIEILDAFLVAIVLFIFAVSIYELFINRLDVPAWMIVHSLPELKVRLSSVLILVMAVRFLERLMERKDPQGLLFFAIAITLVSGVLVAYSYIRE